MRTRCCFLVMVLALAVVAGACGKTKEPAPGPVDMVAATERAADTPETDIVSPVIVLTADVLTTLDPYYMVSVHPDDSIAAHLWDTLVWLNDDLTLESRLAESWRLVDDLTWEIELRQGVAFHNGEPFDAQAVAFSLERTAELEGSLETFAGDVTLQGVEIIDDHTVRIHTAEPAVSMIYNLSTVEMLPPAYYAQTPPEDLARNPVGSGPYELVDWDPGGNLTLGANVNYWQGAPAVSTLVFEVEPDVDTRLARLADGEVDLITNLPSSRSEEVDTEHTQLLDVESTRRLFIGMRHQEGTPLADKRVRQALNYAIDVPALIAEFHAGYGQPYGSWVNSPNADSDLSPWPYDPDKAKDLLAQAGYPDGFEVAMDTPVGRYDQDQEIAQAVAAQLAEVGVRVKVQPREWSAYVSERLVPKETAPLFLLSLMSRGNGLEDTQNLAYEFPFNPTLWYNEEFEQLLSQAEETFNQTLRLNLLRQAQAIAYEEAPWLWLWRPYLFYGVSRDLDWWQPRADGLVYLYRSAPATETD